MKMTRLNIWEREAVRVLLEAAPAAIVSMLVDGGPEGFGPAATQVLLRLAEWELDQLADAYVASVPMLEMPR